MILSVLWNCVNASRWGPCWRVVVVNFLIRCFYSSSFARYLCVNSSCLHVCVFVHSSSFSGNKKKLKTCFCFSLCLRVKWLRRRACRPVNTSPPRWCSCCWTLRSDRFLWELCSSSTPTSWSVRVSVHLSLTRLYITFCFSPSWKLPQTFFTSSALQPKFQWNLDVV